MSKADRRAQAKRIGQDVEDLVVDAVDGLQQAPDDQAHHDAVATTLVDFDGQLTFGGGICLLEADTLVEIKACRQTISNGVGDTYGRWYFKGCRDGQHAALLETDAVYALTVYNQDSGAGRSLAAVLFVPASTVDVHLEGAWYDSGCEDGQVAKLSWPALLDGEVVGGVDP